MNITIYEAGWAPEGAEPGAWHTADNLTAALAAALTDRPLISDDGPAYSLHVRITEAFRFKVTQDA